ncbi:MAG: cytochrome P450 [Candidatus Acidiferrales bacterium]
MAASRGAAALPLPPGPSALRFLYRAIRDHREDRLAAIASLTADFGDIAYLRILGARFCLLAHPDHIEYVLVKNPANFLKSRDYRALEQVLGKGLLTSEGAAWQRNRKLIQPAFRHESIAIYADIMSEVTARSLDRWRDGETRDVHAEMMALALEIVGKSLFGSDVTGKTEQVGKSMEIALRGFPTQALLAFAWPARMAIPKSRGLRRATRELDALINSMIAHRRAATHPSSDLLQMLLDSRDEQGTHMTDAQLRDELMTLFLAGHETTANALSWTWLLLSQNPAAESALHDELRAVLGDRAPVLSDLPNLPYAEMVIKESMRLYPPAYAIGRRSIEVFELGGHSIPAETNIILLPWLTHRDPRFYSQPADFFPERWLGDPIRNGRLPRFAYFPFGGGPRVCVGAGFAMMEAVLLLATIAQRFSLRSAPGSRAEVFPSVTLRPKSGVFMSLHARS